MNGARTWFPGKGAVATVTAAALLYALFINAGTLTAILRGHATLAHTGIRAGSIDEAHTFALMREVADGHLRLGSASLKEHRDDGVGLTYGPLLQGGLLRLTGWSIQTIIFVGDFLLLFCIALLFLRITSLLIPGRVESALSAMIALNVIGTRWLRAINPQVSFLIFAAYLALFLEKKRTRGTILLRSCLLLLLLPVHIHYALYALVLEWCDAARKILLSRKEWKAVLAEVLFVTVPLGIAFALRTLLPKTMDLLDAERRLGLIPSRLPAAPRLQCIVLSMSIIVAVLLWKRERGKEQESGLWPLLSMLLAGLFVLNQSILHGKDAIFGVYFEPILLVAAAFALCVALGQVIRKKMLLVSLLGAIALWSTVHVAGNLRELSIEQRAQAFPTESTMEMIQRIATEPGEQVILAPLDIADLIPVFTSHYVLFNRYSRFGNGSDRELAERFLLLRSVVPATAREVDNTYGLILGQYAGNIAARKRTLCRIRSFLFHESRPCTTDVRGAIYHQDILRLLETGAVNRLASLRKFHVTIVIVPGNLPDDLRGVCKSIGMIESFTVATCTDMHQETEAIVPERFRRIT